VGGTGVSIALLGASVLDSQTQRPLCLIDIVLQPSAQSDSVVDPGESTAFYVRSGKITFTLNLGGVRVVPPSGTTLPLPQNPDGSYKAVAGNSFTISAGGTVYLDVQSGKVGLIYKNASTTKVAALLIASAPPTP
jgi:hypothetical protein